MCCFRLGSTNDDEEEEARERRRRLREERKKMRDLEESGTTDVINTNRYIVGRLTCKRSNIAEVISLPAALIFIQKGGFVEVTAHFLWRILRRLVLMVPSQSFQ